MALKQQPESRTPTKAVHAACMSLAAVICLTGCASPGYMANRGRDAADIFTASAGAGIGAKVRIGPFGTGLLLDAPVAGLRGGDWLSAKNFANPGSPIPMSSDVALLVVGGEEFVGSPTVQKRGKAFAAGMICGVNLPTHGNLRERAEVADKIVHQTAPDAVHRSSLAYLTQVEIVAGLGPSIRLGCNPGELLDFGLGWFGIDIFHDDVSKGHASNNQQARRLTTPTAGPPDAP